MRQSIQGKLKLPSFLFVGSDNQLLTTLARLLTCNLPPAGMALPFARPCGSVAHECSRCVRGMLFH